MILIHIVNGIAKKFFDQADSALHHAGVATLTHTPSPMRFLNEILDRPRNETPFLLLVAGYPHPTAEVPNIEKLPFDTVVRYVG